MRPRFFQLLPVIVLSSVALGTPLRAEAQDARIVIGARVDIGGPRASAVQVPWQQPYGRDERDSGPWSRRGAADRIALDNGYRVGYEKGIEDARDRRGFDPRRHRAYRNADIGYERRFATSRDRYEDVFRRGFLSGYGAGFADAMRRLDSRDHRYGRDRNDPRVPLRRW